MDKYITMDIFRALFPREFKIPMFSFAKKREGNYVVLHCRKTCPFGYLVKGYKKKRLMKENPIYTIEIDGKEFVMKQITKFGEDEWGLMLRMIQNNLVCPQMIDYYACLSNIDDNKRYILMQRANMDLRDYLFQNEIADKSAMILNSIEFALDINNWCVKFLKLVYIDWKCKNILVLIGGEEGSATGGEEKMDYKLTDIGLMDDVGEEYIPNWEMLCDDDIVNFMYPRRSCQTSEQLALFQVAMFIIEIILINHPNLPELEFLKKTEKEKEKSNGNQRKIYERNSDSEDDESEEESEESEESEENNIDLLSQLNGRHTDEKVYLLFNHLPFFKISENKKIKKYLLNLINFKYQTVEDARKAYSVLCKN